MEDLALVITLGFLLAGWVCLVLTVAVGVLLWRATRQEPRAQTVWELVDLAAPKEDAQTPELGSAVQARRLLRELQVPVPDTSAPWDGQKPYRPESVTFPEEWRWEWPDAPPQPSKLPDEEA
jgi:hypothetical protein